MKDKFIIINDEAGDVLNGTDIKDNLKAMIFEETVENYGHSENLLIYKLYATVLPIEIKLVSEVK